MVDAPGGTWAVLLAGPEDLRPDVVAKALASFRGIPMADAAMAVRRGRGVVAERLGQAEAEDFARRLLADGIGAVAIPESTMADLPKAALLGRAVPGPDGLLVVARPAASRLVPWSRIRLVAIAPFHETTTSKTTVKEGPSGRDMAMRAGIMAVTGMPVSIGGKKKVEKTVSKTEFHLYLDLLLRDPAERLRVDGGHFDFSGLGARMAYSSLPNVKALLEEIVRGAPGAVRSPGADLLLAGGRLAALGYDSVEEFEREERWLGTVVPG